MDVQDQERVDAERGHRITSEREVRIRDWLILGSAKDRREWKLLTNRLWMKRWRERWTPEQRAHHEARVKAWKAANPEKVRELVRRCKAKLRKARAPSYLREKAAQRAKREAEKRARRAATVYTCWRCGSQWSPAGRIPCRVPTHCGRKCKAREQYERHGEKIRERNRRRWAAMREGRRAA